MNAKTLAEILDKAAEPWDKHSTRNCNITGLELVFILRDLAKDIRATEPEKENP